MRNASRVVTLVVIFASMQAVVISLRGETLETISICELLNTPQRYDGKIVRVEGSLRQSGSWSETGIFDELFANDCSGVSLAKMEIGIEAPDQHLLEAPPPGFKLDRKSILKFNDYLLEQTTAGRSMKTLPVIVEGLVVVSKDDQGDKAKRRAFHKHYAAHIIMQAIEVQREREAEHSERSRQGHAP